MKTLTKDLQATITPEMALDLLRQGNKRFINNLKANRNLLQQANETSEGQHPFAIILSCIDSRTSAEIIFDQGLGDIFSVRIAGNIINEDILGSMEFACKVSGSKLILVMGHEHCGAVKAAIDDVKLGNITPMLTKIKPAVSLVDYTGERTSNNQEFVHLVCESNVRNNIIMIRENSPILKEMEANGEIKIVGAVYDMDNGQVSFLKE
jgi:carbonic anhydrase